MSSSHTSGPDRPDFSTYLSLVSSVLLACLPVIIVALASIGLNNSDQMRDLISSIEHSDELRRSFSLAYHLTLFMMLFVTIWRINRVENRYLPDDHSVFFLVAKGLALLFIAVVLGFFFLPGAEQFREGVFALLITPLFAGVIFAVTCCGARAWLRRSNWWRACAPGNRVSGFIWGLARFTCCSGW